MSCKRLDIGLLVAITGMIKPVLVDRHLHTVRQLGHQRVSVRVPNPVVSKHETGSRFGHGTVNSVNGPLLHKLNRIIHDIHRVPGDKV